MKRNRPKSQGERENEHLLSRSIFSNLIHLKIEKINQRTNTPENERKRIKIKEMQLLTVALRTRCMNIFFIIFARIRLITPKMNSKRFGMTPNHFVGFRCSLYICSLFFYWYFWFYARSLLKNSLESNIVETIITVHSRLGNKRLTGDFFFRFLPTNKNNRLIFPFDNTLCTYGRNS